MRVVYTVPPLFAEIDAAFNVKGKPVIFCFGQVIYNPEKVQITRELHAHEFVHGERQREQGTVEDWWHRYIADPEFRLAEEIPAHQMEYLTFCQDNEMGRLRTARRLYLNAVAGKLSSPLYGNLISREKARSIIKAGAKQPRAA